ncbi:PepSY domain-containing protein [Flammeovirga sp. MY04]|uniref:PepSY-associated TM helix domain-containing protein n=1 Tax=Flammeovirga sp. MY04 TaxID=1191459 RepID=UPI0008061B20|nr:PepSY-associated TM helix domain-containing protein [Flammeovirga sp. MY04]ANQ50450.1 PepSY domain-containing protein [Flammeovirga sp. MY04]
MKKGYSFKQLCADLHLWLGVATSIVLVIVCFTGTVYTYEAEIKAYYDRHVSSVENTEGDKQSVDELIQTLSSEKKVFSINIPADEEKAYVINMATPEEIKEAQKSKKKRRGIGKYYYVDQYNADVLGTPNEKVKKVMMGFMMVHRHLGLGWDIGRPIVGWSTIIFIIISLTGFVLWLPKKIKQLKAGLTFKKNAGWKRINYDLHNVLGFYSLIILLLMGITGPFWSFDWYRTGLNKALTGEEKFSRGERPKVDPVSEKQAKSVTYQEILDNANIYLDYKGDVSMTLPSKKSPYVAVRKTNKASFFSLQYTDQVYYNAQNGELIKADLFKDKPLGKQLMSLVKAIHLGYVFNGFSKLLYFVSCLIATTLPVTGLIIWINKLKKKKQRKKKKAALAV